MLKKLIKHELRATRRFFLPAYGVFIALLLVERLSLLAMPALEESEGFLSSVAGFTMAMVTVLTVVGLIALMVAPAIYNIIRFYRNMLGDEGYLMFTLPVSTGQLIWSKLLTAVFWETITGIVVIVFGGAFLATLDAAATKEVVDVVSQLLGTVWSAVGGWTIMLAALFVLALFTQMCANMLTLYTSMSIGQCAGKHRLLASAGCYVGINFVTSWLMQIPIFILGFAFGEQWMEQLDQLLTVTMNNGDYVPYCQIMSVILIILLAANFLLGTIHYFLSRYFLRKQLNLA